MLKSNKINQIIKYGCIIFILIFLPLIFLEVKTECYEIYLDKNNQTNKVMYRVNGILTKSFWHNTFYLNVDFDNPDNHRTVGIFILKDKELKVLEAHSRGEYKGLVTESGYSVTNELLRAIEKRNKGNMINKMLKNKDNLYICVSQNYDAENVKIEECNKIILIKN